MGARPSPWGRNESAPSPPAVNLQNFPALPPDAWFKDALSLANLRGSCGAAAGRWTPGPSPAGAWRAPRGRWARDSGETGPRRGRAGSAGGGRARGAAGRGPPPGSLVTAGQWRVAGGAGTREAAGCPARPARGLVAVWCLLSCVLHLMVALRSHTGLPAALRSGSRGRGAVRWPRGRSEPPARAPPALGRSAARAQRRSPALCRKGSLSQRAGALFVVPRATAGEM